MYAAKTNGRRPSVSDAISLATNHTHIQITPKCKRIQVARNRQNSRAAGRGVRRSGNADPAKESCPRASISAGRKAAGIPSAHDLSGSQWIKDLCSPPSECSSALCNCVNARRDITLLPLKFLFHNFRYFFTLFSKFFSYFLHSTFSLSIFKQYLELREIYHAFCTVISNSATLRRLSGVCSPARSLAHRYKIITFSDSTFQSLIWITVDATGSSQADSVLNYNSIGSICPDSTESKSPLVIDLKFVLFLFHSPLLKKSLLFSFPTLN